MDGEEPACMEIVRRGLVDETIVVPGSEPCGDVRIIDPAACDLAAVEGVFVEKCSLPGQQVLFAVEYPRSEVVTGHDVTDHHGKVVVDAVGDDLVTTHGLVGLLPVASAVGRHVEDVAVETAAGAGRERYGQTSEVEDSGRIGEMSDFRFLAGCLFLHCKTTFCPLKIIRSGR